MDIEYLNREFSQDWSKDRDKHLTKDCDKHLTKDCDKHLTKDCDKHLTNNMIIKDSIPFNGLVDRQLTKIFHEIHNNNYEIYCMWSVLIITIIVLFCIIGSLVVDYQETKRFINEPNYNII